MCESSHSGRGGGCSWSPDFPVLRGRTRRACFNEVGESVVDEYRVADQWNKWGLGVGWRGRYGGRIAVNNIVKILSKSQSGREKEAIQCVAFMTFISVEINLKRL